MISLRSLRFLKKIFIGPCVRHASTSTAYYQPDPFYFLPSFPPDRMTMLAFRASKDYIHYSHAEICDSTRTIRILDAKPISLIKMQMTPSRVIGAAANQVHECIVQGDGQDGNGNETKPRKSTIDVSAVAYSTVSRIIEESPAADAFVVERIPGNTMRVKDRTMLEVFSNISRYTEVLRAQLVIKWRKDRGIDGENGESSSQSPVGAEPIFDSSGRFVDKLFDVRKSDTVCESLIPIVTRLPYGYPTSRGVIKVEIPDDVIRVLYERTKGKQGETKLMENHLLCAVILESVAFAKYLLDARGNIRTDATERVN